MKDTPQILYFYYIDNILKKPNVYFTPISDITIGFVTKPNSLAIFLRKNIQKEVKKGS